MDYIQPAHCTEQAFRSMWTEFEVKSLPRARPQHPARLTQHTTVGEQSQHQLAVAEPPRLPPAPHGRHQHVVPHARSKPQGRVPVSVRQPVRPERVWGGRAREPKRGAGGAGGPCDGVRAHTESESGAGAESGESEGAE